MLCHAVAVALSDKKACSEFIIISRCLGRTKFLPISCQAGMGYMAGQLSVRHTVCPYRPLPSHTDLLALFQSLTSSQSCPLVTGARLIEWQHILAISGSCLRVRAIFALHNLFIHRGTSLVSQFTSLLEAIPLSATCGWTWLQYSSAAFQVLCS